MARSNWFSSKFPRGDEKPDAEPEDVWDRFELASLYAEFLHNFVLAQFERSIQRRAYAPESMATPMTLWVNLFEEGLVENAYAYLAEADDVTRRGPPVLRFSAGRGPAWEVDSQRTREYRQRELPLQVDETEQLKSRLIDMAREVKALRERNKELRQQVQRHSRTQDRLLARVKQYQEALEGMRIAAQQDAKGLLLFSERYNGRVEEVTADSMDVVFDDNDGGTFAQSYSSDQLAGAKMPEPGDWIYAFAAVYRSPAKPVSWNEILREDSGIDDLDFPVEEAEGSIDL